MAITPLPKSETDIRTLILNRLGDSSTITAVEHREVENALADAIFYTPIGDIKEVACTVTYINDNFDMNPALPLLPGRGKVGSERYGWAICNGNNGTINKGGRVGIGYDSVNYPVIGSTGGSKDAVVVSHSHTYSSINNIGKAVLGFDSVGDKEGASYFISNTNTVGVSGVDKNMQPYVVTLFIQKIATPY